MQFPCLGAYLYQVNNDGNCEAYRDGVQREWAHQYQITSLSGQLDEIIARGNYALGHVTGYLLPTGQIDG